ncbi:hypothetical protein SDC9_212786 [bioreactor metagenome]|uniref:Uncharacterized protein n=1 Tax=bioreactor metagenome TaxID=1076179 RepID=A0A645JNT9_9ZZZZ
MGLFTSLAGEDALFIERTPNLNPGGALHVFLVHPANNVSFDWNNGELTIQPFVAEYTHMAVGDTLLEALDRAPLDVIRDAADFLLCKRSKQRQHQLAIL